MEKSFRPFSVAALLFAAWMALAAHAVCAPRKPALAPAPPQPVEITVKVTRGEPADIPLRIYGSQGEQLFYLIRVPPRHGKTSDPRAVDREVSVVTYDAPADMAVKEDKFSYAVKSAAGVSAPVDVFIKIVDTPSQLSIPASVAFTPMLAGTTVAKEIEIVNYGGGFAEGEATVDAPWKIEGTPKYRLAAGERGVLKVVFAPTAGGKFEGEIRFSSHRERATQLAGEAVAPIALVPAALVLAHPPGDPVRTGAFDIVNNTDGEKLLVLAAAPRLHLPAEARVPAHGKLTMLVQTDGGDVEPVEGAIRVNGDGYEARVAVSARAVGPILRAKSETLIFGPANDGSPMRAMLELENIGGTAASASIAIPAPFRAAQTNVTVAPREKQSVEISLPAGSAGHFRTWMTIENLQQKIDVAVQADAAGGTTAIRAEPMREASRATASPSAASARAEAEDAGAPAVRSIPDWVREAMPVQGVRVVDVAPTAAAIQWPAKLSDATQFRTEKRELFLKPDQTLGIAWTEDRSVKIERQGDNWIARLAGLVPAQPYAYRVWTASALAGGGERLFTVDFHTPEKPKMLPNFSMRRTFLWTLVVVLGAIFFIRIRARIGAPQRL